MRFVMHMCKEAGQTELWGGDSLQACVRKQRKGALGRVFITHV